MDRYVDMKDISDGRLYDSNDLVKADCHGCRGCAACCQGMGSSIVLDPLDVYRLIQGLNCSFEQLLAGPVELNMADGTILPNLKMQGEKERCAFLGEDDRCRIHSHRPGICRLFPLGRFYENGGFKYFLQIHECKSESRTKVKVRKWIDTPDLKENEAFISRWHYFLKNIQGRAKSGELAGEKLRQINMYVLQVFYLIPYDLEQGFYPQFYSRLDEAEKQLSL